MNTIEQINQVVQALPAFRQVEVLDFANYLAHRSQTTQAAEVSFQTFAGALTGSENFNGDPVEIQRSLRDEWRG